MSSSDRRSVLIALGALPLAACGFTPAYAPGGPAAGLRGKIRADDPTSRDAFDFVGELEARLGTPDGPRFTLGYSLSVGESGSALTPDGVTGRYNVTGSVNYTLRDAQTGATVSTGKAQSFVSYGATGSTVATLSAQADAHRRLMVILADEVVTRLLATSGSWNK
ncbi:LPS assembly lipoprotein LptE [Acidimangrovimonas sediminis]|uniref:LPS assembly lipoprotein LptE n=1 Tax=Acidimangrovimonas sediminis TaxID=2056283 RepID=UPI000C8004AC|nr:LPS assembly lipoprotein LptE [Acidimangrovimonas sediminis]